MKTIFRNLLEYKGTVILIVLLLVIQAYCDLALPTYTSDIVDIGLEQNGVRDAVPETMRKETLKELGGFLGDKDKVRLEDSYEAGENSLVQLKSVSRQERAELAELLTMPEVVLFAAGSGGQEYMEQAGMGKTDLSSLMKLFGKKAVLEQVKSMAGKSETSGMMFSQIAVQFVCQEYKDSGLDLNQIQRQYLIRTGFVMLLFSAIMVAVAVLCGFLSGRCSAAIGQNLRGRVFHKVLTFSNQELDHFSTASLITRCTNDVQQVQMVTMLMLRIVAYAPILGIGGVLKVLSTHTGLGWIILLAVGIVSLLMVFLFAVAIPKFRAMQKLVDRLNLVAREILTGLTVIRAFGREKHEEKRFDDASTELMKTQLFTSRAMTSMFPAMMLIMNGVSILIVWFGGKGIQAGNMQVGDMIAFITYSMQIIMSFLMIAMIAVILPRAGVAANRIQEVLDTEPAIRDAIPETGKDVSSGKSGKLAFSDAAGKGETAGKTVPEDETGVLEFHDVSFRYNGGKTDAVEHICFKARPGQTTAIIGSTGSGKSTIVNLIPRFYDVTGGCITLDGRDIRDMELSRLRAQLGFVPQKGILMSGSIMENLRFGGADVSEEDAKWAAGIAQASEFIDSDPDGYGRMISQSGTNVSGGQKQRLAIARALAKHPKLCVFDDSFSALDYRTDALLRNELRKSLGKAAVIIVAQRISTVLYADQILVLEEGRLVGKGTHRELMDSCPEYREIARSQLSEEELAKEGGQSHE